MENHRQRSDVRKFSCIIFKLGKDIYYPKISDELNEAAYFDFPELIFQTKVTKFGT